MVELSALIKISIAAMILCPVVSIIIYFLPQWRHYVDKFDHLDDEESSKE